MKQHLRSSLETGGYRMAMPCLCLFAALAQADVAGGQQREIAHLLDFVAGSDCTMIRNGSEHPGHEAVRHIRRKYDYFRDEIETTEDFIRLSATKSTMSGRHYRVHCPGEESMRAQDWLLQELARFRRQQAVPADR